MKINKELFSKNEIGYGDWISFSNNHYMKWKVYGVYLNGQKVMGYCKLLVDKTLGATVQLMDLSGYCKVDPPKFEPVLLKNEVYVLFDRATGLHKIGRTQNFKTRFPAIKKTHPETEVVFSIPAERFIEHELHCRFRLKLKKGREWFLLDQNDIEAIKKRLEE